MKPAGEAEAADCLDKAEVEAVNAAEVNELRWRPAGGAAVVPIRRVGA